jgi:hypothetical protein
MLCETELWTLEILGSHGGQYEHNILLRHCAL